MQFLLVDYSERTEFGETIMIVDVIVSKHFEYVVYIILSI